MNECFRQFIHSLRHSTHLVPIKAIQSPLLLPYKHIANEHCPQQTETALVIHYHPFQQLYLSPSAAQVKIFIISNRILECGNSESKLVSHPTL